MRGSPITGALTFDDIRGTLLVIKAHVCTTYAVRTLVPDDLHALPACAFRNTGNEGPERSLT